MKNLFLYSLLIAFCLPFWNAIAQDVLDTTKTSTKLFIVVKNDGAEYFGRIISQDEREVLIETKKLGKIYIPKHEIKEIKEIDFGSINKAGDVIRDETFSSRYFINTNGLPMKKGDSYIQWNLYGPDFQFGVAKNLNVGVMTSWVGVPIIGNAKYSITLGENLNLGVGTLLGTGSWAQADWGLILPFSCITVGNKKSNVTFSAGYGSVFEQHLINGRLLLSVAGIRKVGEKISVVFDSFIIPKMNDDIYGFALFIPGLRWQPDSKKAFQFGFAGIMVDGTLAPFPYPMIQWFRKL